MNPIPPSGTAYRMPYEGTPHRIGEKSPVEQSMEEEQQRKNDHQRMINEHLALVPIYPDDKLFKSGSGEVFPSWRHCWFAEIQTPADFRDFSCARKVDAADLLINYPNPTNCKITEKAIQYWSLKSLNLQQQLVDNIEMQYDNCERVNKKLLIEIGNTPEFIAVKKFLFEECKKINEEERKISREALKKTKVYKVFKFMEDCQNIFFGNPRNTCITIAGGVAVLACRFFFIQAGSRYS